MGIKKYQGLGALFVSECLREVDQRRGIRPPALNGAEPIVTTRPVVRSPPASVTQLLKDWRSGNPDALEQLTPLVYDELRRLADAYMKRERAGHTLQATAIVHEAYVRLIDMEVPWEDRSHFFSVAARLMRRILVDHARQRAANRRAGTHTVFELQEHDSQTEEIGFDIVEIDNALNKLAEMDPRLARMAEIHYFAGLSSEDTAAALGISLAALQRDLRVVKAWLLKAIRKVPRGC